jgi:hypothetical protein
MPAIVSSRKLESPLASEVSTTLFTEAGETLLQPDGCWDFAFLRRNDGLMVLRTGLTTRPVIYRHEPGDETLAIKFNPSTFMPLMPGDIMRDEGVVLERFGSADFWLGEGTVEIPTLENADVFVEQLARAGYLESNDIVASVVEGHPRAMSERTLQRHFLKTTGLTYKSFTMIERAQKAVDLLRLGRSAADVAFALGYSDQPHLIHSLRAIMGQTPGQIGAVNAR